MRHALLLALTLSATVGCSAAVSVGGPPATGSRKPAPPRQPGVTATRNPGDRPAVRLPASAVTRLVPQTGQPAQLIGKVKLISDMGGAVVSNNAGALVSNQGGALVANNGGSAVSTGGAALGAPGSRRLAQAAARVRTESLLADAVVWVRDGQDRVLVDEAGAPLVARTDPNGDYRLEAVLPAENLVLAVPLAGGGQLSAIAARTSDAVREVPIDTATSLGTAYVLERFVKGSQQTLDRLPASEAERLRVDLDAARGLLDRAPSYRPEELVSLTDELRKRAPAVDRTLEQIKALLLGQANLGNGLPALEVPLSGAKAVLPDGEGGFYISEAPIGRIRRVSKEGRLTTWADQAFGTIKAGFVGSFDMARGPDGALYVLQFGDGYGVARIGPDGSVRRVAGSLRPGADPLGGQATETAIRPWTLWVDGKGVLWIAEDRNDEPAAAPRVMTLSADGRLQAAGTPRATWGGGSIVGLTQGPEGAVLAAVLLAGKGMELCRLAPGAAAWTLVQAWPEPGNRYGDLATGPDGTVYLAEHALDRISRVAPDGTRTPVYVARPDGLRGPADMQALPDGRLLVVSTESNQVFMLDTGGRATVLAGAATGTASENGIPLNAPFASAAGADGMLYVVETGNATVKRWNGKTLDTVAGSEKGRGGDGGPAAAARLDQPTGLLAVEGTLLVIDENNGALREIGADGVIRTRISGGQTVQVPLAGGPTEGYSMESCIGLFRGPEGLIGWLNVSSNQVVGWRGGTDRVELLAGAGGKGGDGGDGDDPRLAKLNSPFGAAYSAAGELYVSDTGNMRIRRVRSSDGKPHLETFGGVGRAGTFLALAAGSPALEGRQIADVPLVLPGALCFDAAGALYVAELGTANLPVLMSLAKGIQDLPLEQLPKVPPRILKALPDGSVSVVAGPGGRFFADPAAGDALALPTHLTIDGQGRLIITDIGANVVRILPAGSY